jgi:hypothetical protein
MKRPNPALAVLSLTVALAAAGACSRSTLDFADDYGSGGFGGASSSTTQSGPTSSSGNPSSSSGPSSSSSSSSSSGGMCSTPADCVDGDNCTTDSCVNGLCQHTPRDDDKDGFPPLECGGTDCNDFNPDAHPGAVENCFDGTDNDCNGVTDCFDPSCANVPNCGCKPNPNGEDCKNGKDDDCNGKVDCLDPGCVNTPACSCAPNETGKCTDGFDNDCDGQIDCNDSDCSATPECQCKFTPEDCGNGVDDNCDGLIDCADPHCTGIGACACVPPGTPEVCNDGFDNDCDGKVDCADPSCAGSASCQNCKPENCTDGKDNNCDGTIDCADPTCAFDPACKATPEVCNNGKDDDHDGLIDCADPDCKNNPFCIVQQANCLTPKLIPGSGSYFGDTTGHVSETVGSCGGKAGEADFYFVLNQPTKVHLDSGGTSFDSNLYVRTGSCNEGKEIGCDDDSGGNHAASLDFTILYPGTYYVFLDGFEVDPNFGPNEGPFQLNVQFTANPPEICNDGIDNDGDHYVDCADPDCVNAPNCFNCNNGKPPTPEFGEGRCSDGEDNDCDGKIDCADKDCSASDYYVTECCNGIDANGNGIIDDFNCRCADDSTCPNGQFCYTHTVFACGLPCTAFFGDICKFVAPGSYCNANTQQCEF